MRGQVLEALGNTLLASFPFIFLFIMLPVGLYGSNGGEFDYKPGALLPFLIVALLSFVILFAAILGFGQRAAPFARIMFFVGLFFAISDSLVPLQWGLMDGTEVLKVSTKATLVQAMLFVVLGLAAWFIPTSLVRAFGVPVVLVGLAWQAVQLTQSLERGLPGSALTTSASAKPQSQKLPNVYQVVFDGYSSLMFERAAAKIKLAEQLQGFTFFKNNMSNYIVTDASVPSFLTGHFFKGGSYKAFQNEAKTGGMRAALEKAGYDISIYAPNRSRFWMYDNASYVYTSESIAKSNWTRLAQIVLVRAAPEPLRPKALDWSRSLFGKNGESGAYGYYKRLSVPLMSKFLSDESNRSDGGHYVYIHLILPHAPFVWTGSDCSLTSGSSYAGQVECATKLMSMFVSKLKELGRYEDSLVILQSDHGWQDGIDDARLVFRTPTSEVMQKVASHDNYFSAAGVFLRVHSLLLIKPPKSDQQSLRISEKISQLVDIPATVSNLLGLPSEATDGRSVFDLSVGEREISMYDGFYNTDEAGRPLVLGRNVTHAALTHLIYRPSQGWGILPDIGATYDGG